MTRDLPSERLFIALSTLIAKRNKDGGIPAGNVGDVSGPWTTASTLRAVCQANSISRFEQSELDEVVRYLLGAQQIDKRHKIGGWAMVSGDIAAVATGEAILALRQYSTTKGSATPEITSAIASAAEWLVAAQHKERGYWSDIGIARDLDSSSILATSTASEALASLEPGYRKHALSGLHYIVGLQDPATGGWGAPSPDAGRGSSPTVSDTCRAMTAIQRIAPSGSCEQILSRGAKYLASSRPRTQKVSLRYRRGPAEVVINNNSVCDLVGALSLYRKYNFSLQYSRALLFLWNSFDRGRGEWRLSDEGHAEYITTWPTADWALAIEAAAGPENHMLARRLRLAQIRIVIHRVRWWAVAFGGILLVLAGVSSGVVTAITIDQKTSDFLWTVVVAGFIVSIAASALWDLAKKVFGKSSTRRKDQL